MAKKIKKDKDETLPAPVSTGNDYRGKNAVRHGSFDRRGASSAPDGVSGNWT